MAREGGNKGIHTKVFLRVWEIACKSSNTLLSSPIARMELATDRGPCNLASTSFEDNIISKGHTNEVKQILTVLD